MMTDMRMGYPLLRRDSFSQDDIEDMNLHSECDFFEFQLSDNWCSAETDTNPQQSSIQIKKTLSKRKPAKKEKAPKRQGRFKNVPYTFGRHFRNWMEGLNTKLECPVVQRFLNKRKQNPRYRDCFKDFNDLFLNSGMGRQLGQIFFGQKLWVRYLQANERVSDMTIYFQVELSYYEAAKNGTKMTEQKVRNCI